MLEKRWNIKNIENEYAVEALADSLNISETLAKVLVFRGISSYQLAKEFFRPTLDNLHDPFLMHDMEKATYRVIKAITENQLITVYGDYDVDGTCSTALLYMFLKELDANVQYYIPQRLSEGYGLSKVGFDEIQSNGSSLIISVDCGITSFEEAEYATELGMDLIICDHHQPKDALPKAYAILDPIKPGCEYPFKYLSGAGVAFKLAQGVSERIGSKALPFKYLDLVALAGAADIVPLIDENRVLVNAGISIINNNPREGIKALLNKCRIVPGNLNSGQIVFTIAPRINAAGRMGDAKRAVELFVTDDREEAAQLSSILEEENIQRRKIDETTLNDALDIVDNFMDLDENVPIVLHQDNWHPGVIGIVASRLVEKYYRPTIMLTTVDGVAKGSARSIANFNIYEAIEKCEDCLLQFGGHKAAAGLELNVNNINDFRTKFNKIVKETITKEELLPELKIDSLLKFSEISPKFLRILDQFTPFGPKNMRPVFLSENVVKAYNPRIVGQNHLLVSFKQEGTNKTFDSIGFKMGEFINLFSDYKYFDIVYTIDKLIRNGNTFPQLRLKDLKVAKQNSRENS